MKLINININKCFHMIPLWKSPLKLPVELPVVLLAALKKCRVEQPGSGSREIFPILLTRLFKLHLKRFVKTFLFFLGPGPFLIKSNVFNGKMHFLNFSAHHHAESSGNHLKSLVLDQKCTNLDHNSDFGHVRTYSWLHQLRNTQRELYGTYLEKRKYTYLYIYIYIYLYT